MPHLRKRHIQAPLEKLVKFSPLTGILGHRQVGKTTFLQQVSSDYRSLDSLIERKKANDDPEKYVDEMKGKLSVIDESQLSAELFPALKERVRKNARPGQFILSGSVRFTSKKAIRESLAGRIQYLELLPLTIGEIAGEPLNDVAIRLLASGNLNSTVPLLSIDRRMSSIRRHAIESYLLNGGLPGICFIREAKLRKNKILDQINVILDRDLRFVYPTTLPTQKITDFVGELSLLQGSPVKFEELKRKVEITVITQQKLLNALESVFVLRRIPIEGGRKGFTIFFEDQAESFIFSKDRLDRARQLVQLLYRHIRTEFFYRIEKDVRFFQYQTRTDTVVPLVIHHNDAYLGFIPTTSPEPKRFEKSAAQSFLSTYMNSKIVFFHEGNESLCINERMASLPLTALI